MIRYFLITIISIQFLAAQTTGYGLRLGMGISSQKWQGGGNRNPLITNHADFYMDSESEKGNIIYGALGYHLRGSSIIFGSFTDLNGNTQRGGSISMKFHQVGLELGAKRAKALDDWKILYGLGIRVEYNLKTQLQEYSDYSDFINKVTAGFTISAAAEKSLSKFLVTGIEARISPDMTRQIFVPQGTLIYDFYSRTLVPGQGQSVKNFGIELSFYIKFLQIVEYIEEF